MSTTPLLELDRASRTFRLAAPFSRSRTVDALRDVSFRLEAGKALALVGESGSGKTTCARAIAGMIDLTAGSIRFRGTDIAELHSRKARRGYAHAVQMVFQDPFSALNPTHTVRHHLARPLKLHGQDIDDVDKAIRQALAAVELDPKTTIGKYPHELSGGELQRVNLARALAVGAELVIADEPTSMLDVSIRRSVIDLIRRLKDERGVAFLVITHDIATASHLADDIAIMFAGQIVEQGPTASVIGAPQHPYSKLLLAALPGSGRRTDKERDSGEDFAAHAATIRAATRASMDPFTEWRPGHFVRGVTLGSGSTIP
jgi:peptide/nickel transport system ATP-binding protein